MPRGPHPSSEFRGPLLGSASAGPLAGAPAQALNQWFGRQKITHNPMLTANDLAGIVEVNIAAATGTVTINNALGAYQGLPVARFFIGQTINQGTHWYQGVSGAGLGASLATPGPRDYEPDLLVNFVTEFAFSTAATVNNSTWAIGLGNADGSAMLAVDGTVNAAAADGLFFYIPQAPGGAGGVSSPIQCVWVTGGAVQQTVTTGVTLGTSTTNAPSLRLGIRVALSELSGVASPIISDPTLFEFWINDIRVAQMSFGTNTGTGLLPLSVAPAIAGVDLVGGTDCVAAVPFWTYSIGPMRAGSTTV